MSEVLAILRAVRYALTFVAHIRTLFPNVLLSQGLVLAVAVTFRSFPGLSTHTNLYLALAGFCAAAPAVSWHCRNAKLCARLVLSYLFKPDEPPSTQHSAERVAFRDIEGQTPYSVSLGFWGVVITCAFLGWGMLVAGHRTSVTVPVVTPTVAGISMTANASYPETPPPMVPTHPPVVPTNPLVAPTHPPATPTIIAESVTLRRNPSSMTQYVDVELNQAPGDDLHYWVLREDWQYPGQFYPQALHRQIKGSRTLTFAVALPFLDTRTYELTIVECTEQGDYEMRRVADKDPEEFVTRVPDECKPIGDEVLSPPK